MSRPIITPIGILIGGYDTYNSKNILHTKSPDPPSRGLGLKKVGLLATGRV